MDESTRQRIVQTVEQNEIVLFMKETPQMPQCGFYAQVIQILDTMGAKYDSVNVLADAEIRNGIKEFSDWPTIPQLYIRGEFVGGCDIVRDMFESGELEQKLGVELADVAPPNVSVSERAAQAFKEAIQEEDEYVRL